MEYKTITKPDGSGAEVAVYDAILWMEGLYDSLPDTAEKSVGGSPPVKIDRRGTARSASTRSRSYRGNRLRQAGNHGGRLKLSGTGVPTRRMMIRQTNIQVRWRTAPTATA